MQGGKRIGIYPAGGTLWNDPRNNVGTFRVVHQLTPQLADSANEYAFMSLGLAPETFIGTGIVPGMGFGQTAPLQSLQAPFAQGIPTQAGQFVLTPLQNNGG